MKNIVITGSTRGIGFCMAGEFLKHGCRVTFSGRSAEAPEPVARVSDEFPGKTLYVPCDVTAKEDHEKLWNESAAKWGKIDIWINNAGRNVPYEPAYETGREYVEAVIDTNLTGMIYGSQVAAKNMLSQGGGQIWNMEGLGSNDMIQAGTVLYGTTKHALTYFTKGLAKELEGTPVTAGRLSPGMMPTDFITKTPDGEESPVKNDRKFQYVFNILADRPETVAAFIVPRMLANMKNDVRISWLTGTKATFRFMSAPFRKRKLL